MKRSLSEVKQIINDLVCDTSLSLEQSIELCDELISDLEIIKHACEQDLKTEREGQE